MYVRCTHCGYDNSPEYRFCGMCGASLAHPPVVQAAQAKEPARPPKNGEAQKEKENVHGPSFLGLAEDPKVEFHYLYEDEEPKSHAGMVLAVLLLLGAGGLLGWQWKNNGFPFNRLNASTSANSSGAATSASPSEVAPAGNQDQETHINKPMTGAGDVLPTQPEENSKSQGPAKATESEIPPQNSGQAAQPTQNAGSTEKQDSSASDDASAAPGAGTARNAPAEEKSAPAEEANAAPPASVAGSPRPRREPAPASRAKPQPALPAQTAQNAAAPDADLEATGERYLYGTGVPQNCARAESSLRTAAMHGNSKAETVLGTMYATGHCVGRDLPTAYHWFARALHQEPQNTRISVDLQVLWRQMTPQEKQLAMSGQ